MKGPEAAVTISSWLLIWRDAMSVVVCLLHCLQCWVFQYAFASVSDTRGEGHHPVAVPGQGPWLSSLISEAMWSPSLRALVATGANCC